MPTPWNTRPEPEQRPVRRSAPRDASRDPITPTPPGEAGSVDAGRSGSAVIVDGPGVVRVDVVGVPVNATVTVTVRISGGPDSAVEDPAVDEAAQ